MVSTVTLTGCWAGRTLKAMSAPQGQGQETSDSTTVPGFVAALAAKTKDPTHARLLAAAAMPNRVAVLEAELEEIINEITDAT